MKRRNHNTYPSSNFKYRKFDNIQLNKDIGQCYNLRNLLNIYKNYRYQFNEVNLATFIYRIAKLSKQRHQFDSVLWNQDKNDFIRSFYNLIEDLISQFNSQELANTFWALATLKVNHPHLITLISQESMKKISQFNSQNLANTIWALATLKVNHPSLINLIANESIQKISQFNSQNLANSIWALATLKVNHPPLVDLIANESIQKISQFSSQELANTIWALATLRMNHPPLITLIANESMKKISQFNSQELANTIWALATLKVNHSQLITLISNEIIQKISQFNSQELANSIWAMATLNVNHSPLIHLIANESMKKISQFNSQNLANTIWALATLNIYHSELFCKISSLAIIHLADFNKTEIRQMYYVYLAGKYIWRVDNIDELLPLNVICLYYNAKKIEVSPSELQKEVFQFVSQQINCQYEFITKELLSIDIAIQEQKIAIEVNGPTHYLSDKSLDGSSVLKYRLLESFGWEVIVIPYFEWNQLSSTEKTNYIKELLNSNVC